MVIYTSEVEATSSLNYNLISSSTILSKEQILEDSFRKIMIVKRTPGLQSGKRIASLLINFLTFRMSSLVDIICKVTTEIKSYDSLYPLNSLLPPSSSILSYT